MIILVLNCGSSSLKYQLLDMEGETNYSLLAKGLVERIGMELGALSHRVTGRDKYEIEKPIKNHTEGIKEVLSLLVDPTYGVLGSLSEINAVGHRVAHGGEYFFSSQRIDNEAIEKIEKCCELAPLHNPANLLGIKAILELMPNIPQVAVFDTSFHQTMPAHSYMYAIPYKYYLKYKIRRYGFHGTSHKFVADKAATLAGIDINNSKIITCHLGNGSSITAIQNGKSIDTSMGFTPVEGVVMGTRSGNVDAGVLTFLMEKEDMNAAKINSMLNKESGFLGISGISSDSRDIHTAAEKGDERAQLTIDAFCHSVLKYIGAYTAVMGGLDLLVFTGGIGENDWQNREQICKNLGYLGVDFDAQINHELRGTDQILTKKASKTIVATVTTNEELVIARDTMNIVK